MNLGTVIQHLSKIGEPFVTRPASYARIALGNAVILAPMPHQFGLVVEGLLAQPACDPAVG